MANSSSSLIVASSPVASRIVDSNNSRSLTAQVALVPKIDTQTSAVFLVYTDKIKIDKK